MAAAQLGITLPPRSVHEQSYWDNRERAAMQEQADNLEKREKAISHLPRDSESYKLQIATIARQRAFIEQQRQDFEDSVRGRQEAKK